MTESWFDPDAIRGDIESTLTELFQPPVFSATVNYQKNDLVRLGGFVFRATAPAIGALPPAAPWEKEGRALPLVYENVPSALGKEGGLLIRISWMSTRNESIGCESGSLRSIEGVLSCWILSPKNMGTSYGVVDAARLRRAFGLWNAVSDCGKQVRMYAVNGPRTENPREGSDFYAHIVTCSMVAMERVNTLR